MKKLLLIPLLSLSLFAGDQKEATLSEIKKEIALSEINFCEKFQQSLPGMFKSFFDAYSIEQGKEISCFQVENVQAILQDKMQNSLIVSAVTWINFSLTYSGQDRVNLACNELLYNIIIDKAIKTKADSIDKLKAITDEYKINNPLKNIDYCKNTKSFNDNTEKNGTLGAKIHDLTLGF